MTCCVKKLDLCIAEAAAKTFRFQETGADFSAVTEITFDVWADNINGSSVYSGSLTGGEITVPDPDYFQLTISETTSAAFAPGTHYCEAWLTLNTGARLLVGAGTFKVINTRKHD